MPVQSITTSSITPPSDMISSRAEGMDRADFLRMLTAQLKAQDPLNPLSGQDFASQLATFSSLQELQGIGSKLDQSLEASLLLTHSFNNTMAASLIGKVVRAEANTVTITGNGQGTLAYQLSSAATDVNLEVLDSDGKVVRTISVPAQHAGSHSVTWDGLNSDGRHVTAGTYTFRVNATDAEGSRVTATTFIEGVVSEVRYQDGNVILMVGDREISLGQVLSLRDPSQDKKG
ncbi:copper resistance protein CopC [bacterium]|nr:copper resistance protein CopC [bacterium]MBU1983902.1 copper resistance protein CopC [bacterium]